MAVQWVDLMVAKMVYSSVVNLDLTMVDYSVDWRVVTQVEAWADPSVFR